MPQMAEKTSPDAPPNCAVVPQIKFPAGCKPANKKSSPKWDLLQENLAEGGEKEVQHK